MVNPSFRSELKEATDFQFILLFSPYGRDGSEFRLLCPNSAFNLHTRDSRYGFSIARTFRDHIETLKELDIDTSALESFLAGEYDNVTYPFSKHISHCHSFYGSGDSAFDDVPTFLNKHYGTTLNEELSVTSLIIL